MNLSDLMSRPLDNIFGLKYRRQPPKKKKKRINNNQKSKYVCSVCGARFVNGRGFVEDHYFPCANDRYGWNFCDRVPMGWKRKRYDTA